MICHGGDPIPKSPVHINVAPLLDLSKVSIQGLNSSEYILANVCSEAQKSPPGPCELSLTSTKTSGEQKEECRCSGGGQNSGCSTCPEGRRKALILMEG